MMLRSSLAALVLACACGVPAREGDAGDAATTDAMNDAPARPPRAVVDAGMGPQRACSGPGDCESDEICDHDFPHGLCTHRCSDDTQCATGTLCEGGLCFARCDPGANQCRQDAFCYDLSIGIIEARAVCYPSCSPRADATDQRCDVAACVASFCASTHYGPRAVGDPCSTASDCATNQCGSERAGYPGGMCYRLMRLPPFAAWLDPGPMPHGGCPDDEVVTGSGTEGDAAVCMPRCIADADCRDGYRCDHTGGVWGGAVHDDGACVSWICGTSHSSCPADRTCAIFEATQSRAACFRVPP